MKNKNLILLAVFVLGIVAVAMLSKPGVERKKKAAVGLPAPVFELKDTQGKSVRLAELKGKVVLVTFWATWCDSCKDENPSLQRLVDSRAADKDFVFLSILYDDSPARAVEYMKQNGFTFPVLVDDKNTFSDYGITGVPETFIINKKGVLVEKVIGPIVWDAPDIGNYIAKLSAE